MTRSTAGRRRTGILAAVLAAAALAVGTGCGTEGGSGWRPPAEGQASVLFRDNQPGSRLSANELPGAMYLAPDGTLTVYSNALYTVSPDRTVTTRWQPAAGQYGGGLAALPGGAFAYGARGRVYRRDAEGRTTPLAGAEQTGDPVKHSVLPRTAPAAGYRFYGVPTPFGVRPDGTLLVSDEEAVWALKDGTLTLLYAYPGDSRSAGEAPRAYAQTANTVDGDGNAYVGVANNDYEGGGPRLDQVRVLRPDGTSAPLALPAKLPGVGHAAADLVVTSMAGGDGESVYVGAVWNSPEEVENEDDYLLRVRHGAVTVLAHHHSARGDATNPPDTCTHHMPMQGPELPCALPWVVAYSHGRLVMGGYRRYYLALAV